MRFAAVKKETRTIVNWSASETEVFFFIFIFLYFIVFFRFTLKKTKKKITAV